MNQDTKRLLLCAQAIHETIVETGGAPSGHIYAAMMSLINLDEYNHIIASLKKAKLIKETHFFIEPLTKKTKETKNELN